MLDICIPLRTAGADVFRSAGARRGYGVPFRRSRVSKNSDSRHAFNSAGAETKDSVAMRRDQGLVGQYTRMCDRQRRHTRSAVYRTCALLTLVFWAIPWTAWSQESLTLADNFDDNSLSTVWTKNALVTGGVDTTIPVNETNKRIEIGPL